MKRAILACLLSILASLAHAGVSCTVPNTFVNNTIADANQVNANFTAVLTCLLQAASAGNNSDITALNALTTPISPSQGGSNVYIGTVSTGPVNAQIIGIVTPAGFSITRGYTVIFIAGNTNTGPMQVNVNGGGLVNLYRQTPGGNGATPQPMTGGELQQGQLAVITYDGTQWEFISNGPQYGGFGPVQSIAAAPTTDLTTAASHNVAVTGAATITNFGSGGSFTYPTYLVVFQGASIITYNATSCLTVGGCILIPGNANLVTASGDVALMQYLGTPNGGIGNWQVYLYQKANGTAPVAQTPLCGFNGLTWGNGASSSTVSISWSSASLITAGGVALFTGAQTPSLNITLGNATPTAGGMDGSSPGINKYVYMYAISNGTLVNVIGSPASTIAGVSLPTGYIYACYLGAIKVNNTGNLYGTTSRGRLAQYVVGGANLTALPLAAQVGGGTGCGAWTSVAIQGSSGGAGGTGAVPGGVWAPATASAINLVGASQYNGLGASIVEIAPNASYAQSGTGANPPPFILPGATLSAQYQQVFEQSGGAGTFQWCSTNGGGAVLVQGYTDTVNAN